MLRRLDLRGTESAIVFTVSYEEITHRAPERYDMTTSLQAILPACENMTSVEFRISVARWRAPSIRN
jgi:hypothetical protein